MPTPTPLGYFDLLETLPLPGCAVCRLLERDDGRFLDTLLYEHPVDPTSQNDFRASRGLCHDHAWRLPGYNNALAVGILYNAVLDELLQISEQTPPGRSGGAFRRSGAGDALAAALDARKPCPACVAREQAEDRYLLVLGENVTDERLWSAWQESSGLCLPHFRGALRHAPDADSARRLAETQRERWTALKGEVEMLLHKLDAHYHQSIGAESTSWLRALAQVAGEKRSS